MHDERKNLLKAIAGFGEAQWLNAAFDQLKELLEMHQVDFEHTALSMSVTAENYFSVNIGSRIVWRARPGRKIHLILPKETAYSADCKPAGKHFLKGDEVDALWMAVTFEPQTGLKPTLKKQWLQALANEIEKGQKSRYKKSHSQVFFNSVMRPDVREELFVEAFGRKVMEGLGI